MSSYGIRTNGKKMVSLLGVVNEVTSASIARPRLSDLSALYAESERNFELRAFWDGGVHWRLGDEINGFTRGGCECSVPAAVAALLKSAREDD